MYTIYPDKRYKNTLELVLKFIPKDHKILDLGIQNPFSEIMKNNGYEVSNTIGEDLDFEFKSLKNYNADIVTAFEILEHLVNPMQVLRNLPADKLLVSVPLSLWFAKPYRNLNDPRDWHYHEFVDWQFDMLLEKSGWEIKYRKKWTNPSKKLGLRTILRYFTPRYYAIYAERKQ